MLRWKRNSMGSAMIFFFTILSSPFAIPDEKKNPFVGTWKLITFETRRSDGGVMHPFGKDLQGAHHLRCKRILVLPYHGEDRPLSLQGKGTKARRKRLGRHLKGALCYWERTTSTSMKRFSIFTSSIVCIPTGEAQTKRGSMSFRETGTRSKPRLCLWENCN